MCLAVPGKILNISPGDESAAGPIATVDFQGNRVEVSLAMTPEAREGDWVLVHAGFALNQLNEDEARETWDYLQEALGQESTPSPSPFKGEGGGEGETHCRPSSHRTSEPSPGLSVQGKGARAMLPVSDIAAREGT